jgi:hypothetical protein
MAAFLRLTTSDAGRGAFLVLVGTLGLALVVGVYLRSRNAEWQSRLGGMRETIHELQYSVLRGSLGLLLSVIAVIYPSSKSGSSSKNVRGMNTSALSERGGTPTDSPAPTPTDTATPTETTTTTSTDTATPTEAALTRTATEETPNGTIVDQLSIPLFDLSSLGERLQQYVAGVDLVLRYPLFGVGGGNFRFVAAAYGLPNKEGIPIPEPLHNVYIMLLAETGLPGFLLYMGAVGLVFGAGLRSLLEDHKRDIHLVVLVGFVAFSSFMFFTHLIDRITVLIPFWALGGAVLGERAVARTRSETDEQAEQ